MQAFLRKLWTDESGQDATEYVLLVMVIALGIIAGMQVLQTAINDAFQETGDAFVPGGGGAGGGGS